MQMTKMFGCYGPNGWSGPPKSSRFTTAKGAYAQWGPIWSVRFHTMRGELEMIGDAADQQQWTSQQCQRILLTSSYDPME